MGGSNPLQRGTADRGLSGDPDVEAYYREQARLVEEVRKTFREESVFVEIIAQETINNAVPLRKVWETGEWTHAQTRWIFLRHYLRMLNQAFGSGDLGDEVLLRQIHEQEREYQRLERVSGQRWQGNRLERHLKTLEQQEYQSFLRVIEAIRTEAARERFRRFVQVHPATIKSSIFTASGAVQPFYELFQKIAPYVSIALDFIPIVGQIKGIAEVANGRDLITGDELSLWARGVGGVLSFLPFAKGIFSVAKAGIRVAGRASQEGLRRLAALAYQVGDSLDPRQVYQITKQVANLSEESLRVASRIPADRVLTAGQRTAVEEIVKAFPDVPAESVTHLSRTASGVIESGRGLQRPESGVILPKPTAPARAATKTATKLAQELLSKGYLPEAIGALERLSVKIDRTLVTQLDKLGNIGRDFVNLFHRSKGFHEVVSDLVRGSKKAEGAEFVMRYATDPKNTDILAKVRRDPSLIIFEWGIKKSAGPHYARKIDLVLRGDRTLGEGDTIYREFKSWTASTLRLKSKKDIPLQLVRDLAILDPKNIRWVFDSRKITQDEIIKAFLGIIEKDAYLTKVWGKDPDRIRAALERVVELYPKVPT